MPIKKRMFGQLHRVIVRRYINGPKNPPQQSIKELEVFDTEESVRAKYEGEIFTVTRINPELRGGISYELVLEY